MAKNFPDPDKFKPGDPVILSGLLGILFELLFGLEIIFSSLFLYQNVFTCVISAVGFTIVFVFLSFLFGLALNTFIRRGLPLLVSYLIIILLIPGQTISVLAVFVIFVAGNSILKIVLSRLNITKSLPAKYAVKLAIFSFISFFVIITMLSNSSVFLLGGLSAYSLSISDFIFLSLAVSVFFGVLNLLEPVWIRNFIFPLSASVMFSLAFSFSSTVILGSLETAFAASLIIALISYKLKFLTLDGVCAQFVLAFLILGLGGWKWTVPIIVFFFSSSLLSKIKSKYKNKAELLFEKTGTRDSGQVLVNGGLGGLLVMLNALYPSELFYLAYVSSIAVVCSDTWATEIGTIWRTSTVSIINFFHVDQGTSGGVSLPGTAGALIGAFIIPVSSLFWTRSIFLIFTAGFTGSIADSYLGAKFQAQYKCSVCGKISEKKVHCNKRTSLIKGCGWYNNDAVNFTAAIFSAVFVLFLKEIIKV